MTAPARGLRNGFALPVTIFALVAIGAIVTGGFYVSGQENRISMSMDLGQEALTVSEYGLQMVLGTWMNQDVAEVASTGVPRTGQAWAGDRYLGSYQVSADSLGGRLFLVRVEGTATQGSRSATRLIGGIGRTTSAELPYESAVTVLGALDVAGNSGIDGTDLCEPTTAVPGVTAKEDDNVSQGNNVDIEGEPEPVDEQADMDLAKLSQFGDVSLEDLIEWATKTYPAGANPTNMSPATTTDGSGNTICDTSVQDNWGDTIAVNPCGGYYPLIYAEGDLTIDGGGSGAMGQGVLIVEGDLTIAGNVKFKGVVIAKGKLSYSGTGGHVEGSTIVMGDVEMSEVSGNATFAYNHCIIEDVFNGALRVRPLATRSWVDLGALVALPSAS